MSSIKDLTVAQLQRAIDIRQQIEDLETELASLGGGRVGRPPGSGSGRGGKRRMSAAGRAAIAAAARARWAKYRSSRGGSAAKPARKKRAFSSAARARLSAMAKARWAKAKASGKSKL